MPQGHRLSKCYQRGSDKEQGVVVVPAWSRHSHTDGRKADETQEQEQQQQQQKNSSWALSQEASNKYTNMGKTEATFLFWGEDHGDSPNPCHWWMEPQI